MDKEIKQNSNFKTWEEFKDALENYHPSLHDKITGNTRRIIVDIISKICWFFQRLFRGYSDPEWWDFYGHLSRYAIPRLQKLRENRHGYPAGLGYLEDDKEIHYDENTFQLWQTMLDKMILAFQLIIDEDLDDGDKRVKEGLDLFRGWFFSLWD